MVDRNPTIVLLISKAANNRLLTVKNSFIADGFYITLMWKGKFTWFKKHGDYGGFNSESNYRSLMYRLYNLIICGCTCQIMSKVLIKCTLLYMIDEPLEVCLKKIPTTFSIRICGRRVLNFFYDDAHTQYLWEKGTLLHLHVLLKKGIYGPYISQESVL